MEVKILDEKNKINSIKLNQSITGYDLLNKYYQAKDKNQIVAFFLNDKVHDLFAKINNDATVKFIFQKDIEGWKALNYGCALVLAYVIKKVYPEAIIAVANNNEDGFYLDFDYKKQLKQEDFLQLTDEMNKVLHTNFAISLFCQDLKTTFATYQDNHYAQEYAKLNQINDQVCSYLVNNKVKVIASSVAVGTSQLIKYFKLTSITGAYWLANDKNKQLQRITGIADWSQDGLAKKIKQIDDRKNQDHRFLGKKLGIFLFNDEVGKGLPLFLPNGMAIKKVIQEYLREQEFKWDYQEVTTPVLGSVELYKKSGHWDHYRENMFSSIVRDNEQLVLRPMTCPHHCIIYQSVPRSYRDLPIRLSEHALLYRYEASGALTGLERVRSMELTDSHIFARPDQIKQEFKRCYHLIAEVLRTFKIKVDYLSLSLRDPKDNDKYYSDNEMWDQSENALREVLTELKLNYKEMIGEAAFYGPKVDVQIKTALGHEITISTIQFDFLLPKRFNLTYVDNQNQTKHPVIIHRGIIGTYERFIATLLEQTQGVLPLWLAPKQLVILPVNDTEEIMVYSAAIRDAFKAKNIRATVISTETLGKRIRSSHEYKIPYVVVIGNKELNNKKITYHTYQDQKHDLSVTKEALISKMLKEINNKEDQLKTLNLKDHHEPIEKITPKQDVKKSEVLVNNDKTVKQLNNKEDQLKNKSLQDHDGTSEKITPKQDVKKSELLANNDKTVKQLNNKEDQLKNKSLQDHDKHVDKSNNKDTQKLETPKKDPKESPKVIPDKKAQKKQKKVVKVVKRKLKKSSAPKAKHAVKHKKVKEVVAKPKDGIKGKIAKITSKRKYD